MSTGEPPIILAKNVSNVHGGSHPKFLQNISIVYQGCHLIFSQRISTVFIGGGGTHNSHKDYQQCPWGKPPKILTKNISNVHWGGEGRGHQNSHSLFHKRISAVYAGGDAPKKFSQKNQQCLPGGATQNSYKEYQQCVPGGTTQNSHEEYQQCPRGKSFITQNHLLIYGGNNSGNHPKFSRRISAMWGGVRSHPRFSQRISAMARILTCRERPLVSEAFGRSYIGV